MMRLELIDWIYWECSVKEVMEEIWDLWKMVCFVLYEVCWIIYDLRLMVFDDLGLILMLCKYFDIIEDYNEGKFWIMFIFIG